MAPALYNLCWQTLAPLAQHQAKLVLMRGKYVIEVAPSMVDKGTAIQHFLQHAPFAGRTPIFIGDDSTDEAGFATVQNLGGHGIKVGAGPSAAQHRCPNPSALRAWLAQALSAPQPTAAYTAARQQVAALQPATLQPAAHAAAKAA